MAPRVILDDSYKLVVTLYIQTGLTSEDISTSLFNDFGIKVSPRTIDRKLRSWDITWRTRTEESEALLSRIQVLFSNEGLTDEEMLQVLVREGFHLGPTGLLRLRRALGLVRRINHAED